MERCERSSPSTRTHPEALVWHGSGLAFRARRGVSEQATSQTGGALFERGLRGNGPRPSRSRPTTSACCIPRGAVLLQATRIMPPDMARPLLETAVQRLRARARRPQSPYFATLGDHPKGELLFGLADGYSRLGEPDKARVYFDRLIDDAPTSGQAPKAQRVDRDRHAAEAPAARAASDATSDNRASGRATGGGSWSATSSPRLARLRVQRRSRWRTPPLDLLRGVRASRCCSRCCIGPLLGVAMPRVAPLDLGPARGFRSTGSRFGRVDGRRSRWSAASPPSRLLMPSAPCIPAAASREWFKAASASRSSSR